MHTTPISLYAVLSLSPDVSEALIDARFSHMRAILDERINAELKNRAQGNQSMLAKYRRMRELLEDIYGILGNPERRDFYDDHKLDDADLSVAQMMEAFNLFYGSRLEDFDNMRMESVSAGAPYVLTQKECAVVLSLYHEHKGSLRTLSDVLPMFSVPGVRQACELYLASMISSGCLLDEKKFWKHAEHVRRAAGAQSIGDDDVENDSARDNVDEQPKSKKHKRNHNHDH